MGAPRPMPLDDDDRDDDDYDDRRPPKPSPRGLFGVAKWLCLGFGFMLAVAAFAGNAIQAGALAGLACFMGITSRVMQAEEHRKP